MSTATDVLDESATAPHHVSPAQDHPMVADQMVTVLEPRPGWQLIDFRELWRYRELLFFLTWRDVKIRYKQTVLGAAWALLQPLATMVVFSLFFRRAAADSSSSVPYPLFVLAGLVPWMFFSNAIASAGQSVVGSSNLVTKVYFPRLIIPMGAVKPRPGRPGDFAGHAARDDALVRCGPGLVVRARPGLDARSGDRGLGCGNAALGPDGGLS